MEEKQLYGYFKRQICEISHKRSWTWLRKENLKGETGSLFIAAQNNTMRINYIKENINKSKQNSKCSLCGDRDEMINHIIIECSKLVQQKHKTRYDYVGKEDPQGIMQEILV